MNPAAIAKLLEFAKNAQMVRDAAKTIGNSFKDLANDVASLGKRWYNLQDISFKTARTMAMSRQEALKYNESLIKSTKELAAQYGISAKELDDFQKTYSESVGRNIRLSREQMAHMSAFAKITDNATAAQLVDDFDKIGIGISGSLANIGYMQEKAKAFGINATKATQNLKDNIKLASSYSFKNGVADIEKMSIKAASMRMDMSQMMHSLDRFSNIENAIKNSANIQMLGGSFSREFSNPMGVMYEAMADPDAFIDRIGRLVQGKGTYNAKTGEVKFDPVTMMQLREAANQLGMSVDQLTNPAITKTKDEAIAKQMGDSLNKFTKEQQAAIKNLARGNFNEKTGKYEVQWLNKDGEVEKRNVEDLTVQELKIAQDSQLTERNMQMDVRDIKNILEMVHGRARETKSMKEGVEGLSEWWNATLANWQDIYMRKISTGFNRVLPGEEYFAEGGIVKEPIHAEFGAMIPGDSYSGDKVHAMVNSGEMILNKREQKGLFDILKGVATTGAMIWGGNKLGNKLGVNGLGYNAALGGLISGRGLGAANLLGAGTAMLVGNKMMRSGMMPMGMPMGMGMRINPIQSLMGGQPLTLMNPTVVMNGQTIMNGSIGDGSLVEELEEAADAASDVTRSTRSFSMRLRDLSKKNTFLGKSARGYRKFRVGTGRFFNKIKVGTGNKLSLGKAKALNWFGGTKFGKFSNALSHGTFDQRMAKDAGRFKLGNKMISADDVGGKWTQRALRGKGWLQQFGRDTKSLFSGGDSSATKTITKETSAVAKTANASTKIAKAAKPIGNVGKAVGVLGKAGKVLGKAAGPLGAVLAIGSAVGEMSSASSQYDAKIDEIEKSGMSELDKARAKDKAAKEKNASYGNSIGTAAGAAIGGTLGMALGPLGAIAGGWLGSKVGGFLGKGVGSLFGGGEEDKLKKEEEKKLGIKEESIKGHRDVNEILKSIDSKVTLISARKGISSNMASIKPLGVAFNAAKFAVKSIGNGIRAVSDGRDFLKVNPKGSFEEANKTASIGPTEIKLNISGTIKLEGGGKSAELDLSKLLESNDFKRQLAEIINSETKVINNAGKNRGEYNVVKK